MNDNFRELLGVVAVLVLVVCLVNVMSMLFLAFTGTSTSIWIFAVPSKNVGEDITWAGRDLTERGRADNPNHSFLA